jgi:hypothetical protein
MTREIAVDSEFSGPLVKGFLSERKNQQKDTR